MSAPPVVIDDLASLLAPVSIDAFSRARSERHVLHVPASKADRFQELMTWDVLDELIERGQLPGTNFRLMRQGTRVPREWFTRDGEIDARALKALLRQPVTVVLLDIGQLWRPMRHLLRRLQQQLGHNVICGAIATLSRGGAFQPHYDANDLILLQVEGRKRWRIFAERGLVASIPSTQFPIPNSKPVMEFTMERGDLLFLPRGVWHDAEADEDSLHVGLHFESPTGVTFGRWLMRTLEEDEVFAEDIPVYLGAEATAAHEARLKARFTQLVAEADLSRCLRDTSNGTTLTPAPSIANTSSASGLATHVELVAPRVPAIDGDDGADIDVFGVRLEVTPAVRAVLDILRYEPLLPITTLEQRLSLAHALSSVRDALDALDRHGVVNLRVTSRRQV